MTIELTRSGVAAIIDHTLLKPEATRADAAQTVAQAQELGVLAVCLSPSMFPLETTGLRAAAVSGFPSGKHHSLIKAAESKLAVDNGVDEIDMVIDIGAAFAGEWDEIFTDVLTVREAIGPDTYLKVILESAALLTQGPETLVAATRAAVRGGADMVKTSTGFHPAGGASVEAVQIMAQTLDDLGVRDRVGIKASGGIRTADAATALIAAGATRLGLSSTAAVLEGFDA